MTTTTAPRATFTCPAWCTSGPAGIEGWDIETATGRPLRIHEGPSWGHWVYAAADEYGDQSGTLTHYVSISDVPDRGGITAERARELAGHLLEAAAWVEGVKAERS